MSRASPRVVAIILAALGLLVVSAPALNPNNQGALGLLRKLGQQPQQ